MYRVTLKCMCMKEVKCACVHASAAGGARGRSVSHLGHGSAGAGGPTHWGPMVMAFQDGSKDNGHGIIPTRGRHIVARPEGNLGHGISICRGPFLAAHEPSQELSLTVGRNSR